MELYIGVDEVGRGAVFGPLVVCAVAVIQPGAIEPIRGVRDSKAIKSEKVRQRLAGAIRASYACATATVGPSEINARCMNDVVRIAGVGAATQLVQALRKQFTFDKIVITYDGTDHEDRVEDGITIRCVVRADESVYEVSAASIVAKVTRDNWVHEWVQQHPEGRAYDLDSNKGYGAPKHISGLMEHGQTDQHRDRACKTLLKHHLEKKEKNHVARAAA